MGRGPDTQYLLADGVTVIDETQIQRAMERIYSDESVTEELVDEEADALLAWGEQQVTRLAGQIDEGTAFDEATTQLRKLMRHINQLVGLRADLDDEQQRAILTAMVTLAQGMGYALTQEMADVFLQQPPEDNLEAVRQLTELVSVDSADESTADSDDALSDDASWLV